MNQWVFYGTCDFGTRKASLCEVVRRPTPVSFSEKQTAGRHFSDCARRLLHLLHLSDQLPRLHGSIDSSVFRQLHIYPLVTSPRQSRRISLFSPRPGRKSEKRTRTFVPELRKRNKQCTAAARSEPSNHLIQWTRRKRASSLIHLKSQGRNLDKRSKTIHQQPATQIPVTFSSHGRPNAVCLPNTEEGRRPRGR